jgi:hypothetical protein
MPACPLNAMAQSEHHLVRVSFLILVNSKEWRASLVLRTLRDCVSRYPMETVAIATCAVTRCRGA